MLHRRADTPVSFIECLDEAEQRARAYLPRRARIRELFHTQAQNIVRLYVTRTGFAVVNTRSAATPDSGSNLVRTEPALKCPLAITPRTATRD